MRCTVPLTISPSFSLYSLYIASRSLSRTRWMITCFAVCAATRPKSVYAGSSSSIVSPTAISGSRFSASSSVMSRCGLNRGSFSSTSSSSPSSAPSRSSFSCSLFEALLLGDAVVSFLSASSAVSASGSTNSRVVSSTTSFTNQNFISPLVALSSARTFCPRSPYSFLYAAPRAASTVENNSSRSMPFSSARAFIAPAKSPNEFDSAIINSLYEINNKFEIKKMGFPKNPHLHPLCNDVPIIAHIKSLSNKNPHRHASYGDK